MGIILFIVGLVGVIYLMQRGVKEKKKGFIILSILLLAILIAGMYWLWVDVQAYNQLIDKN